MGSLYNSRYFFFALFPSPFFGGPFPLLFIRSSFTFLLLSSGSSNSRSSFLIRSGYHEVSVGPISALFKSLRPVGRLVSLSAVWNIRAAARAIFRADAAPPPGVVAIASSSSSPLFFFFFFFFCKKEGRQRDGDFFLCRQRERANLLFVSKAATHEDEREREKKKENRQILKKTKEKEKHQHHHGGRRRKERRQRRTHQLESEGPGTFLFVARSFFSRAKERERTLCFLFIFFSSSFFKNETQRRRSDDARSRRTRLTPRTLPRDAQDNAEVHFKVRTGTKFKKVRLFDFFSLVARSLVEERNYALALFSNPRRRELISAPKIFSSLSHNVRIKQIFDAFLQRKSLQPGSVRFLFDGERVREDQSPQELDMEDGDSLDVMMEQVGGEK